MPIYFFDASAIVKRYVQEPGSIWIRQICDARDNESQKLNRLVIAEISRVEVAAAFAILVRRNEIPRTLGRRAFLEFSNEIDEEYRSIRLAPMILRNAAELTQRHPLKAYDAVQLAASLAYNESLREFDLTLTFVSGDDKLIQAARAEGLATDNPFEHTDLDTEQR